MSAYDSISLNGTFLRPSPFVSTSYEYAKSGRYTIGGVVLVTLSGTLVAKDKDCKDIITQIKTIRDYNNDHKACYDLIIGCSGQPTFLQGAGKIRSATATKGDQPCIATYTIIIAIETKPSANGISIPIIDPDPEFLERYPGITKELLKGVGKYEENISLKGDESNLSLVDSHFGVTKSYVKFDGTILVSSMSTGQICKEPTTALAACIKLIKKRYQYLMKADFALSILYKKLADYKSWSKWLDTKDITINTSDGSVTWSFSLIMTKGLCKPMALVDISTVDSIDTNTKRKTRSIQGTIDGLSKSVDDGDPLKEDVIENILKIGACKKERLSSAQDVFKHIKDQIDDGGWPRPVVPIEPTIPKQIGVTPKDCTPTPAASCYQRTSSSNTVSPLLGRITFNAEFADRDSCAPGGATAVTFTIEEKLSVETIVEIIIPGVKNSVLQKIGRTPHTVSVTVQGTLSGCDTKKIKEITLCTNAIFKEKTDPYSTNPKWLLISQSDTTNTKSYSRTIEYMECDS